MEPLAVWWLTVQLWRGGPWVAEGPYTEIQCIQCGESWDVGALKWQARTPKVLRMLKQRPIWVCFPGKPVGPDVEFLPPQLERCDK